MKKEKQIRKYWGEREGEGTEEGRGCWKGGEEKKRVKLWNEK